MTILGPWRNGHAEMHLFVVCTFSMTQICRASIQC